MKTPVKGLESFRVGEQVGTGGGWGPGEVVEARTLPESLPFVCLSHRAIPVLFHPKQWRFGSFLSLTGRSTLTG